MKSTLQVSLSFLTGLILLSACNQNPKQGGLEAENVNYTATEDSICTAPANWFNKVAGLRKTPPPNEGPTSVFANNETVNNCDFHQWSWQKFLWLTNDDGGQPFFLDNLIQVTPSGTPIEKGNGVILTEVSQASSTSDILKTNSHTSDTVYYSIFVDSSLYETMVKYAPIAAKDPSQVEDITFPIGALEVKISWVNANALDDTSSYFVTDGQIKGVKSRIALLGMHVVGVVENHPEFVWATFEHDQLAPAYDWSKATPTSDAPVTSTTTYPFFNAGDTATVENITSKNGIYTDVFSVYKFGVPVQKETKDSLVFMKTSQNGPQNFNNILTINESVKKQLTDVWNNYFYNGSIWINTEGYEGTEEQAKLLDSLSYHLSDSEEGDLTRGSVAAYNITMETYVQVGFSPSSIYGVTVSDLANCFSCHNASGNNSNLSPLYISHVFSGNVKQQQGLGKEEIKQAHVQEIIKHFKLRKKDDQAN